LRRLNALELSGRDAFSHQTKDGAMVPFNEEVASYSVSLLKNDFVNYRHVIRLTLVSGHKVFIAFPLVPPAAFLTITADQTNVLLPVSQYADVYHLLQTEKPVYFSALKFLGSSAVNLSSSPEPPGEGLADADALLALLNQARRPQAVRGGAGETEASS
jgi:hypothetical protein